MDENADEELEISRFKGSDDYLRVKVKYMSATHLVAELIVYYSSRIISAPSSQPSNTRTSCRRARKGTSRFPGPVSRTASSTSVISVDHCQTSLAGDTHVVQNFGESWLAAFRGTEAFAVWDRVTDPVIFDIVEPR